MFAKAVRLAVLVLILAGCAAPRTMTRSEMLQTTARTYCGVDRETLFKAAEAVLRLNDPNDVKFAWPDERTMTAAHSWMVYMVFAFGAGQHGWTFTVDEDPERPECYRARVLVAHGPASALSGTVGVTSAGAYTAVVIPHQFPGNVISQPAVYELFWAQLDYLLGRRREWPTCGWIRKRIAAGETYGDIEPLCLFVNDQVEPNSERGRKILAEIGLDVSASAGRNTSQTADPGS